MARPACPRRRVRESAEAKSQEPSRKSSWVRSMPRTIIDGDALIFTTPGRCAAPARPQDGHSRRSRPGQRAREEANPDVGTPGGGGGHTCRRTCSDPADAEGSTAAGAQHSRRAGSMLPGLLLDLPHRVSLRRVGLVESEPRGERRCVRTPGCGRQRRVNRVRHAHERRATMTSMGIAHKTPSGCCGAGPAKTLMLWREVRRTWAGCDRTATTRPCELCVRGGT